MDVIIAGSRRFPKYGIKFYKDWEDQAKRNLMYAMLEETIAAAGFPIDRVVSGRCWGIDQLGELWAKNNNKPVLPYPANWKKFFKAAGPIRNKEMSLVGHALIAIYTDGSAGTLNMISHMQKLKKPYYEVVISAE